MGTKFTFKDESLGEMTVDVQSFSYSMNLNSGRAFLNIHGVIGNGKGVRCRFALESTKSGHKLTFRDAWAPTGTDPFKVALEVKNILLQFVRVHPDIPNSFRENFLDCIIKHSKQGKDNALAQTT